MALRKRPGALVRDLGLANEAAQVALRSDGGGCLPHEHAQPAAGAGRGGSSARHRGRRRRGDRRDPSDPAVASLFPAAAAQGGGRTKRMRRRRMASMRGAATRARQV